MSATADRALAVRGQGLPHVYRSGGAEVTALRGVDLEVAHGETLALLGPSGSGKSTLLSLLAGLFRPTGGRLVVEGMDLARAAERERAAFRARDVGVVLQSPGRNLLPYANALENLLFVQRTGGRGRPARRRRAREVLALVGLADAAPKSMRALSGGEQQRLAVAAALCNEPRLLLADEPTSQLDEDNSARLAELVRAVNRELGTTVVVVTHDPMVGAAMERTLTLAAGQLVGVAGPGKGSR
jgi:putative ABC transport system ATP-binding protein